MIDHEEKSLHNSRYYSRADENDQSATLTATNPNYINSNANNNNNNNNNNINGNSNDYQSKFVNPHHLTRIPKTSVLDHQQVD